MTGKKKDPDKQYSPDYGGKRTGAGIRTGPTLKTPVNVTVTLEQHQLAWLKAHQNVSKTIRELIDKEMRNVV